MLLQAPAQKMHFIVQQIGSRFARLGGCWINQKLGLRQSRCSARLGVSGISPVQKCFYGEPLGYW